jgi:hypothetical protein
VENIGAAPLLLNRSLHRLDLAAHASDTIQELEFFALSVRHNG